MNKLEHDLFFPRQRRNLEAREREQQERAHMGKESRRAKSASEVLTQYHANKLGTLMFTHPRVGAVIIYSSVVVFVTWHVCKGIATGLREWNIDRKLFHEVVRDLWLADDVPLSDEHTDER